MKMSEINRNKLEKIIAIILLTGLTLGGLQGTKNKAYAQTQKQTQLQQTEQEKAGPELIDYENINLLKSDRVIGKPDFYGNRVVFAGNISKVNEDISEASIKVGKLYHNQLKYEVFLADKGGDNQKRLTYSEEGNLCYGPLFTTDGKGVVYNEQCFTEEFTEKYPKEKVRKIYGKIEGYPKNTGLIFSTDYTAVIGPFATNAVYINLSDGSKKRLKIEEDGRLRRERLKQLGIRE
jgi:hypothetical protein